VISQQLKEKKVFVGPTGETVEWPRETFHFEELYVWDDVLEAGYYCGKEPAGEGEL
jgi:hypothetical protein